MTDQLLNKLYNMGVIPTQKSLNLCDKLSVSSFCRRRLAVVMVRLKMAEHMREAVAFVQQGHVRIGPEAVRDPAFLVTRAMEDMLTWVDTSKIKHKILPVFAASAMAHQLRRSDRLLAVRSAARIFLQIPSPPGITPAAPAVPTHLPHALRPIVRDICHVEGSGQARLIQSRPVQWGVDRCRRTPTPPSAVFAPLRRLISAPHAPVGSKRSFSAATSPPIPPASAPIAGGSIGGSAGGSTGGSSGGAGGRKGGRGLVSVITAAAIAGAAGGAYYWWETEAARFGPGPVIITPDTKVGSEEKVKISSPAADLGTGGTRAGDTKTEGKEEGKEGEGEEGKDGEGEEGKDGGGEEGKDGGGEEGKDGGGEEGKEGGVDIGRERGEGGGRRRREMEGGRERRVRERGQV
ncbi:unnamed protein product [Closterium sp. Yama58-4]|nr:unnamed protein product [Closterium sp. Yama58-4]